MFPQGKNDQTMEIFSIQSTRWNFPYNDQTTCYGKLLLIKQNVDLQGL